MKYAASVEPTANKVISAILAFVMHFGLLLFLMLGVQWATNDPPAGDPMSVDLWGSADLAGAPLGPPEVASPADPVPEMDKAPPEIIETPVEPVKAPPPEQKTEVPPLSDPDIAIEQAKQREAKAKEKALALEKTQQREKEKTLAAALQKERDEMTRRKQREAGLKESLQRERENLHSGAGGGSGGTGAGGSGTGGSGRSGAGGVGAMREQAAYIAKIRAIVTPNIRYDPSFAESVQGSPEATFEVNLRPDGTIARAILKQSSGNAEYNKIIKAAIDKTGRLPLPDRPEILPERRLNLYFRYP